MLPTLVPDFLDRPRRILMDTWHARDGCYRGCRLVAIGGVVARARLRYLRHRGNLYTRPPRSPCAPHDALMAVKVSVAMCTTLCTVQVQITAAEMVHQGTHGW